jgi:hypothetical protein
MTDVAKPFCNQRLSYLGLDNRRLMAQNKEYLHRMPPEVL